MKYNCVICDPDLGSRMKLKQATTQVADFGSVLPIGSMHDSLQTLAHGEKQIDVVFVTTRFSNEDITNFITKAKATKHGQDAAYVVVLKGQPQGNADLAENMLIGGDGLLCEPYSVDVLVEITTLAARVKKERADERQKLAVSILIPDLINQIDIIACLKAAECEPGTSVKKLRDMSGIINTLSPENLEHYFVAVVDQFMQAPIPPQALTTKKYGGVSSRVKKRMEKKLAAELEQK